MYSYEQLKPTIAVIKDTINGKITNYVDFKKAVEKKGIKITDQLMNECKGKAGNDGKAILSNPYALYGYLWNMSSSYGFEKGDLFFKYFK